MIAFLIQLKKKLNEVIEEIKLINDDKIKNNIYNIFYKVFAE